MFKPLLIAAAVVVVPSGAAAQTVTTDCYSRKNSVHCRSTVRPSLGDSIRALNSPPVRYRSDGSIDTGRSIEGERILAEQAAAKAARERDPRTQDAEFQVWRMRQYLTADDCPGAVAYAAATERADLVSRVAEFCGKESN